MRQTLLEMVQGLLAAMDSDEVNSITDTVESNQVALLIRDVYYDIATELELPITEGLFQLNPSGDSALPCIMFLPTRTVRLDWVKYDQQVTGDSFPDYVDVPQTGWRDFLDRSNSLREETSGVQGMTSNDIEVIIRNDRFPDYFAQLNNRTLVFDAFNSAEDTTLQASKTLCFGAQYPEFTMSDTFEPELDPYQFSYLRNRAKVRAFAELKQVANAEASSETRNQKIIAQKRARRIYQDLEVYRVPRFGRSIWARESASMIPRRLKNGD